MTGNFDEVRRHRAELRSSLVALERALARPAPGRTDDWAAAVSAALASVQGDLDTHVAATEGPHGLYAKVLEEAPRLQKAVSRLSAEHVEIASRITDMAKGLTEPGGEEWVTRVREQGTVVLGRLVRHRQRGVDLVWIVFVVDVGGEIG